MVDERPVVHQGHRTLLETTKGWGLVSVYSLEALLVSPLSEDFQPEVILLGGIKTGGDQKVSRQQIDLLKEKFPNSKIAMITADPGSVIDGHLAIPFLNKGYSRIEFLAFLNGMAQ